MNLQWPDSLVVTLEKQVEASELATRFHCANGKLCASLLAVIS